MTLFGFARRTMERCLLVTVLKITHNVRRSDGRKSKRKKPKSFVFHSKAHLPLIGSSE